MYVACYCIEGALPWTEFIENSSLDLELQSSCFEP